MSEITNGTELRVVGMSRSGNHAILHWMLAQTAGRYCLLNCAEPRTNPFRSARPLVQGRPYRVNYPGFRFDRERRGRFSRKDWLVYSYEDCFLTMLTSGPFEAEHDRWVGRSESRRDLLILRDPFNLFASRLRSGYSGVTPKTAVKIWKQHAKQFLELRRLLPHRPLVVAYNDWHDDQSYRRRLAEQLGLGFTDAGKEDVVDCGGGSSFDNHRWHGRASTMNVNQRWKYYLDDEQFRDLFDPEMVELSDRIFGRLPGVDVLFRSRTGRRAARAVSADVRKAVIG